MAEVMRPLRSGSVSWMAADVGEFIEGFVRSGGVVPDACSEELVSDLAETLESYSPAVRVLVGQALQSLAPVGVALAARDGG